MLAAALAGGPATPARGSQQPEPAAVALEAALARSDAHAAIAAARSLVERIEVERPGDAAGLARSLAEIGGRLAGLGVPEATDHARLLLERALSLQERSAGERSFSLVPTLEQLSDLHYDGGRWAECEALDRRILALRIAEQGEDDVDVAVARKNLALDLYRMGRFAEQEVLLRQAAAALERRKPPEPTKLADALGYLAECLRAQGRYREAEPLFLRALALGPTSRSALLSNLGGFYRDQNRYAEALWRLSQALRLEEAREKPSRVALVALWNNLAELYRFQGDGKAAEPHYLKAVAAAREVFGSDHSRLGTMVNQLAELYREGRRLSEAEPLYREALAIKVRALGAGHPDVAHTHEGLGRLLAAAGRMEEAEAELRKALEIRSAGLGPAHPDTAAARIALAELAASAASRDAETLALLDAAVGDLERTASSARLEARALSLRADVRRRRGERAAARADLSRSLELVERLRPEAGGGERTRARYGASYAEDFARLASWLVEDEQTDAAFVTLERARGRALLDQLAAAHADLLDGIAPDERAPLETREAELLSRITADRERLQRLDSGASAAAGEAERAEVEARLAASEADYERLYEDVRNASSLWRGVASAREPIGLAAAQREVVPREGLLLSYLVDVREVLLFVVPPASLPPTVLRLSVTEAAARELHVDAGLLDAAKLQRILAPETLETSAPDGLLARLGRAPAGSRPRAILARSMHALFSVLVPESLWPRLRASREVVIIPDQLLHRLPFEALVVAQAADGPRYWLDDGPPVRYAPSATALLALGQRARTSGARGLVSVADPAFGAGGDARLPAGSGLERLPGTAREAAAIRAAFAMAGRGSTVTSLEGAEAREPRVRGVLGTGRYLHLATHGLVDDRRGELFAALALAAPPADAVPDDDGLLQLHEILRLRLDAELSVLSACESRVGEVVAGEGIFALSRAFLIAGSRRVVATLWPAADDATATLVADLFAGLARADAGRAPIDHAANLARAKRQVRARPGFGDPFYWAGFVLEGAP